MEEEKRTAMFDDMDPLEETVFLLLFFVIVLEASPLAPICNRSGSLPHDSHRVGLTPPKMFLAKTVRRQGIRL